MKISKQKGMKMKIPILKITAVLLMLTGGFSSCTMKEQEQEQNDDCISIFNIVHKESSSILGRWKLVKIRDNFLAPKCYDYSHANIVYEFKTNNVLTGSAEIEPSELWPRIGTHFYSINEKELFGTSVRMLQIGTVIIWYQINSKELVINGSPLDGPTYYFIKIET